MKTDRHARIIELIGEHNIETQEELANLLNKEGFQVTQATVSRDIRKLKLVKVPLKNGKQKYAIHSNEIEDQYAQKYVRILKEAFVSMDSAQNILVIRTVAGMAMAAAAAFDAMNFPGCVGSIAGDDTIMVAIKTTDDTHKVMQLIKDIVY